jgi:hypothetical protein
MSKHACSHPGRPFMAPPLVALVSALFAVVVLPSPALADPCSKLTCRHRSHVAGPAIDTASSDADTARTNPIGFSVGLGAAAFSLPERTLEFMTLADTGAPVRPPEALQTRLDGAPFVTLGLSLRQPLVPEFILPLHLEEHFSAFALQSALGDPGRALGGRADFLFGAGIPETQFSAAFGLSAGFVSFTLDDDLADTPFLMLGPTARVSAALDDLPGWSVSLVGHRGTLTPGGDYASAELALSVGL